MKVKYLKTERLKDIKSLIIFVLCVGILVGIPVYWFTLVPPELELQKMSQDSYTVTGYPSPGGFVNLEVDLGKDSIQGLHNGELNFLPLIVDSQNRSLWNPTEIGVDQWPGSKTEIKYSSNDPVNKRMILVLDKIEIPNNSELKGKTVPINIRYTVNYPVQTHLTEILGGSVTNFEVNSEIIEKNITLTLNNQVLTQKDLDAITINEPWKKIVSLVVWLMDLLVIIMVFLELVVVENFKKKSRNFFKSVMDKIRAITKL